MTGEGRKERRESIATNTHDLKRTEGGRTGYDHLTDQVKRAGGRQEAKNMLHREK